jgi:radical SAM protein with 4Fe4S-binding SPASM domain
MSYSRYRAAGGDCIYVENQRGLLYLSDGSRFTSENKWPAESIAKYMNTTKSRVKGKHVGALRILMGHGCNFNCGYCMQKDIGNPFERPRNKNTDKFISDIKEYLDTSHLQRIEMWGGETLLYWKDCVEIIKAFDKPDIEFYICTNGSPLGMKHVEFFKTVKGRVSITISHDGPGQEEQRGPDIIEKKASVIKALAEMTPKVGFSFNSVLTKNNCDLFAINDYFKNVRDTYNIPVQLVLSMAQIYDATDINNEWAIQGDDLLRFQKNLRDYLEACREQFMRLGPTRDGDIMFNSLFNFGEGVVTLLKEFDSEQIRLQHTNCGASSEDVISVDINGDIRLCPHSGEEYKYGTIETIDTVVIKDITLDRNETHCKDCAIFRLCHSTCPITIPYPVFLKNCDAEKAFYTEKQRMALRVLLDQEVELEDWGLESISNDNSFL